MIDPVLYHGLGNSISHRAGILAELGQKLAQQNQLDALLRASMLEVAPKELYGWLTEDGVMSSLFQFGKCHTKIRVGNGYGFTSMLDAKRKMERLAEAWKETVLINVGHAEGGIVEVSLTAIM
jgi:hypothetical protein